MFADQFDPEQTVENESLAGVGMLRQVSNGAYLLPENRHQINDDDDDCEVDGCDQPGDTRGSGGMGGKKYASSSNLNDTVRSLGEDNPNGMSQSTSPVFENETFSHTTTVAYWLPAPMKAALVKNYDFIPRKEGKWRRRLLEGQFDGSNGSGYIKVHKQNGVTRWHFPLNMIVNVAKLNLEKEFPAEFAPDPEEVARAGQLSTLTDKERKRAKAVANHSEFVSGSVGLKFETTDDEKFFIVAFRTIEERDMWSYHIRRAICMFEYKMIFEEPTSLRTNDAVHLGPRPDPEHFVEEFLKSSGQTEKKVDLRQPPCGGILHIENRNGEYESWVVVADLSSEDTKGMIYLRKSSTKRITNRFLSKLPQQLTFNLSEPIDLRLADLTITKPWTPFMNIEQDMFKGNRRRLELFCNTLEIRIKWEEWFVALGARKLPSSEDNVQPVSHSPFELATGGGGGVDGSSSFAGVDSFRKVLGEQKSPRLGAASPASSSGAASPARNFSAGPGSPLYNSEDDEDFNAVKGLADEKEMPVVQPAIPLSERDHHPSSSDHRRQTSLAPPTKEKTAIRSAEVVEEVQLPPALRMINNNDSQTPSPHQTQNDDHQTPQPPPRVTSFASTRPPSMSDAMKGNISVLSNIPNGVQEEHQSSSSSRRHVLPAPTPLPKPSSFLQNETERKNVGSMKKVVKIQEGEGEANAGVDEATREGGAKKTSDEPTTFNGRVHSDSEDPTQTFHRVLTSLSKLRKSTPEEERRDDGGKTTTPKLLRPDFSKKNDETAGQQVDDTPTQTKKKEAVKADLSALESLAATKQQAFQSPRERSGTFTELKKQKELQQYLHGGVESKSIKGSVASGTSTTPNLMRQQSSFMAASEEFSFQFSGVFGGGADTAAQPHSNGVHHRDFCQEQYREAAAARNLYKELADKNSSHNMSAENKPSGEVAVEYGQLLPTVSSQAALLPHSPTSDSVSSMSFNAAPKRTKSLLERMKDREAAMQRAGSSASFVAPPPPSVAPTTSNTQLVRKEPSAIMSPTLSTTFSERVESVVFTPSSPTRTGSPKESLPQGKIFCPLCGQDKVAVDRCAQTGRPHVITRANMLSFVI